MDSKRKILKAAVTVFSKKGYHQAKMDEIAAKAKVAKGTLYYNYSSKAQLFTATVTDGIEEVILQIKKELESDLPFKDHFRKLIECNISLYLKYSEVTKILFNELSSGIDSKVLEEIDTAREHFISFIEDMLKTGQDKGYLKEIDLRLAAISLIGQIDNLCNYYLKHSKAGITKTKLVDTMYSILSSGLLAEK